MNWNGLELPDKDIYFQDEDVIIYCADCRDILPSLCGVSAVVTDPPYELGFMGKKWDGTGIAFQTDTWRLIMEACLPGAMLLSFGGTRTSHRMACAIEDAGWQIRDTIMFVYGSGFPKSLDISKAIDKKMGAKRQVNIGNPNKMEFDKKDKPATPEAKLWEGYGTALKPAYEPITVAMKPLDGTFANNALKHKVAGLNIDECRIGKADGFGGGRKGSSGFVNGYEHNGFVKSAQARFPADFIHDGSQEVMELFPNSKSSGVYKKVGKWNNTKRGKIRTWDVTYDKLNAYGGDSGSAARFFYCAKSSRSERGEGNNHATVKPLKLMEYLCKLVKMPEYNLILDPFCGSGTTLLACKKLGIKAIGIDSNEEYCEIAKKRLSQSVMELEV